MYNKKLKQKTPKKSLRSSTLHLKLEEKREIFYLWNVFRITVPANLLSKVLKPLDIDSHLVWKFAPFYVLNVFATIPPFWSKPNIFTATNC